MTPWTIYNGPSRENDWNSGGRKFSADATAILAPDIESVLPAMRDAHWNIEDGQLFVAKNRDTQDLYVFRVVAAPCMELLS